MKKKIIIAGVIAVAIIATTGTALYIHAEKAPYYKEETPTVEITQMTETESETETEPITEVETTTESVTEVQTEAPTEPQTEQVTEPQTEQAVVDTSYDDTIDTYSYEEDDDTDDFAPADTQPVYEEPEPVYNEPVSEDTDSGNTDIGESQEDFYEDDDEEPVYAPMDAAKLAENNKNDIQPEDYDKIDWSHTIH